MSFVQRELDRIGARLRESDISPEQYERLYAAQQALAWSLEPSGFRSPYDAVTAPFADNPRDGADCSQGAGRAPS
jgi:hypothetical protein